MEAMANWFNDEEQPENAEKKPLVEEIFKVARAEERCINGELGM
jgi:succinate dehydrogenase flavin-adding protein (antitoxin of CptAB toxin-antitoxin module)